MGRTIPVEEKKAPTKLDRLRDAYDVWQATRKEYKGLFEEELKKVVKAYVDGARIKKYDSISPMTEKMSKNLAKLMDRYIELCDLNVTDFDTWAAKRAETTCLEAYKSVIKKDSIEFDFDFTDVKPCKSKLSDEAVKRAKELYAVNKANRDKYTNLLVDDTKSILNVVINDRQAYIGASKEDLFQSGCQRVCEKIWEYNPYLSHYSTYFNTQFVYMVTVATHRASGIDEYTYGAANKLNSICKKELHLTGLTDPRLDRTQLKKVSKMSAAVVDAAILSRVSTTVSISATGNNGDDDDDEGKDRDIVDTKAPSPEEEAIKTEQTDNIHNRVAAFSKVEQEIIWDWQRFEEKDAEESTIPRLIADDINARRKEFKLKKTLTPEYVSARYSQMLAEMANDETFMEKVGADKRVVSGIRDVSHMNDIDAIVDDYSIRHSDERILSYLLDGRDKGANPITAD